MIDFKRQAGGVCEEDGTRWVRCPARLVRYSEEGSATLQRHLKPQSDYKTIQRDAEHIRELHKGSASPLRKAVGTGRSDPAGAGESKAVKTARWLPEIGSRRAILRFLGIAIRFYCEEAIHCVRIRKTDITLSYPISAAYWFVALYRFQRSDIAGFPVIVSIISPACSI